MKADVDYRVIDLEEEASLLFLTGNHRTFVVTRTLGDRLRVGFDGLTEAERSEWDRLTSLGLVSENNRQILRDASFEDGADLAINVNLTNICNLACTYCFAAGGDYGRITDAMGEGSIDDIFAFIDEHLTASQSVRFEFFGGEPLANFPIIKQICDRSEVHSTERGISYVYRISTNLTLLPKGILDVFARHRFIVSVSIDGGREVQDLNRPAKGGQGSYNRVMANARKVRAASDEISMVARMTVAQAEPSLIDNMRELYDLNIFDYFQIYPGVFPVDSEPEDQAATAPVPPAAEPKKQPVFLALPSFPGKTAEAPATHASASSCATPSPGGSSQQFINFFLQDGMVEQFRDFLAEYPRLFTAENRFKGVLEYERTVQLAVEGQLALAFCSGGRNYFTHSPDRSISPCHRLVGEQAFDVGTGGEGLTVEPEAWRLPVDDHPVCGQCWARYVCGGGCKQENYVASGDLNVLNMESCNYQLLLTEEVLRMMARSSAEYRDLNRDTLADMFVSCGRPVLANGRTELPDPDAADQFTYFRQLPLPGHKAPATI